MRSRDDAQTRTCDSTYRIAMMSPCTPSRPDAKSESTLKPFVSSAMPSTSQHAFFPAARMRLTWSSSAATSRWDFSIAGHARKPHRGARRRALPSRHIVLDGRSKLLLLRGGCLTSRGLFAPPLPLPYRQYIQWLRGLDYDCAKAHWQSASLIRWRYG